MLWRRPDYYPTAYDDDWEDQPTQGGFYQWILGGTTPAILLVYGISRVIAQTAEFGGRVSMTLHGENAVAFGIALMAVALFIHFHYFWGNIYNQIWFAVLGKIISVIIFIGAMGVLIVRIGVYGHA